MQSTTQITIKRQATASELKALGVEKWPIWEKESSEFPWTYDESETCYFLAGDVVITPADGAAVTVGKGDLVTFAQGLSCTWQIRQPVRKRYQFG